MEIAFKRKKKQGEKETLKEVNEEFNYRVSKERIKWERKSE